MKRKILNTVSKKYAFGYVLIGVFLLIFLCVSITASMYVSVQYRDATKELSEINNLEDTFNQFNNDVNISYSFLSQDGIGKYKGLKNRLDMAKGKVDLQQKKRYLRETADLSSTIETYRKQSDILINNIVSYMKHETSKDVNHAELGSQYDSLQKIYSFVMLRFQDEYSAKLKTLDLVEKNLQQLQVMIYGLLLVLILFIIFTCTVYIVTVIRGVAGSIKVLEKGVNSIEKDVRSADPIELHSSDEFEELAGAFNSMLKIIQTQMQKIAEDADIRERLAESENDNLRIYGALQENNLDFLQSRINPHFLFNALNMISAQARIENAEKSAEMMEITASFLRYNLDNITKNVTLEKELDNLKDYIAIQKYRYGGRFEFTFQVSENCLKLVMPCMVLQPLVENSVQHGIGMMVDGGHVWISADRSGDRVIMEIRDNGMGMTAEKIEETYRNLRENTSDSKHIGIRNIYRRLQLFYKNDVILEMESHDTGLCIRMSVPYQEKLPFSNEQE